MVELLLNGGITKNSHVMSSKYIYLKYTEITFPPLTYPGILYSIQTYLTLRSYLYPCYTYTTRSHRDVC